MKEQVERIFHDALDLSASERTSFLEKAYEENPDLRARVEHLLREFSHGGYLDQTRMVTSESEPLTELASYRIQDIIGEGGMGVVYRAEQQEPKRVVALKLIRPGVIEPSVIARFKYEAEVLGRLQHPGVAQVYEAGTTDRAGIEQPYFVMEYIEGLPLTQYANRRNLSLRDRLELVARICDAIEHAHQRGVIHRDLKPANILVTDQGQPKVLDFGVARATDGDFHSTTIQTVVDQLVGTVPYMSPEQTGGDPRDLDVRSDVYALGVVAYELLAERLPHDFANKDLPDAILMIRHQTPPLLSSVDRSFRGDVETILGKALEKDRERRYASVGELAADIRRYLTDEPILARPPSAAYRVRKFAKRNRALVTGTTVAFVALVVALLVSVDFAQDARKEAKQSRAEAKKSDAIAGFAWEMLAAVEPSAAKDLDTTLMRRVLDRAAARVETDLADWPDARFEFQFLLGCAYQSLGDHAHAYQLLESAESYAKAHYPPDSSRRLFAEIECEHQRFLDESRKSEPSLEVLNRIELNYRRAAEAEPSNPEKTYSIHKLALSYLADLLWQKGNQDESSALHQRLFELIVENEGELSREAMRQRLTLPYATHDLSHFDFLAEHATQVLDPGDPLLGEIQAALAQYYSMFGLRDQSLALAREGLHTSRAVYGDRHLQTARAAYRLAELVRTSDPAEARSLVTGALEVWRELGPNDPNLAFPMLLLADLEARDGAKPSALALFDEAESCQARRHGARSAEVAHIWYYRAIAVGRWKEYPEAERLLLQCDQLFREDPGHATAKRLPQTLAELYESWGKPTQAEEWRQR